MAKVEPIVDNLHNYDIYSLEGARIIASALRDKVRSADSLQDLLETHKLAAQFGILNKNIDSNKYGMFRTDDVAKMKGSEVLLGNIKGIWTNTLDTFEGMKHDDHNVYSQILEQYKDHLDSNFKAIEAQINIAQLEADNEEHERSFLQRVFGRRNYPKAKDLIDNDFVKNFIKDAGITEIFCDGKDIPAKEITSESLSSRILPTQHAGDSLRERMKEAEPENVRRMPRVLDNPEEYVKGRDFIMLQEFREDPEHPGQNLSKDYPMRAYKVDEDVTFTTSWGQVERARKGDYILQDPSNPELVYGCSSAEVLERYRPATREDLIMLSRYPRIDGYNPAQDRLQEIFDKVAFESGDLRLIGGTVHGLNAVMLQTFSEAAKALAFTKDEICDFVDSISIKYNGDTDMDCRQLYKEAVRNFEDVIVEEKSKAQDESKVMAHIIDPELYLKGRDFQIVDGETFKKKYQEDIEHPGQYKPTGKSMRAYELDADVSIVAPWGEEQTIKKGGYLLQDPENPKDTYGIGKDEFEKTYRLSVKEEGMLQKQDKREEIKETSVKETQEVVQTVVGLKDSDRDYEMAMARIKDELNRYARAGENPDKAVVAGITGYYCGMKGVNVDSMSRALSDAGITGADENLFALDEYEQGMNIQESIEMDEELEIGEKQSKTVGMKMS